MSSPTEIPGVPRDGSLAASARAVLILSDFSNIDAGGKANLVGAGFTASRRVPLAPGGPLGLAPQSLTVFIDVPPAHYNEQFALSLVLESGAGSPVSIPDPATGNRQPLRIQQLVMAESPNVPGLPRDKVWARAQFVINLQALPIEAGDLYTWILEIDGHRNPQWRASFYVLPEPSSPVLG